MTAPRVLTRSLGGSALARAALAGETPAGWYVPRPAGAAEWAAHVDRVRGDFAGSDWLTALEPAFPGGGEARERLIRSAGGRGVVVVTGQQPGLFGGPLYTWFKALSALALADALQADTGIPVAPVFWAATDDADFLEASTTYVAVQGGVERLTLDAPAEPAASLRATPLGAIEPLLAALERGTGAAVHPEILQRLREAYAAGATVGGAYVTLLRSVIGPLGVAVLDAGDPAVRRAARPLLTRALRESAAVERALEARDRELAERGFAPQVALVRGLSLVFAVGAQERHRIRVGDAAAERARDGDLGPNVLLRPIVERAILPSASYVAGPGEIAYFAQVSAVASALARPVQVAVPRWAGIIIEPHVQRILQRLGIELEELRDPHGAERRLARALLPPGAEQELEAGRAAIHDALATLGARLRPDADPPLVPDAVLAGVRRDIDHRLDRLERRLLAAAKRRHAETMRDVATARGALFPLGRPQERMLNAIPLLARHGPVLERELLDAVREHALALSGRPGRDTFRHDGGADVQPPPRPTESAID